VASFHPRQSLVSAGLLLGRFLPLLLCVFHWPAIAASPSTTPLTLAVQPILDMESTKKDFQPLAVYLGGVTGKRVVIHALPNFLSYWNAIRKPNSYDLIFDDAHFTDYRATKLGYEVLVKVPGNISYSLIVAQGSPITDPHDLVGKRIATMGAPSMGAMRLQSLYPNPLRQPNIVEVSNPDKALALLLGKKRVRAAILPTPYVSRRRNHGDKFRVLISTEPIPHMAISAAPSVDPLIRTAIRNALINANNTPAGERMLEELGLARLEPADTAAYRGQARILEKYWGY